ncbi:Predicted dehydrogenase [Anaerobium acetethylicum]|uniref:Predicted dehydrogenase n=2 Tax=Anaerobium acetethylicum TaxID=1619234 RepID=A0A1D3TW79_9FIRM|nr:Predicted dehydrogenase [Anaerobium acetethylicum]
MVNIMEKLKLGIIGYGFMGHEHVNALEKFENAEIIAVCDNNPQQLEDAKEGVLTFEDYRDLLNVEEINTVIIAVPNTLHKEVSIAAAKAGKNIICEKPAAMSVEEFDEMVKAAEECKVLFSIHHQRRWDKDFRVMKEVYDQKLLGDIYLIKSQLYGVNGNMHDWHVFKEMGGGMLYDWGVHLIDQMLDMVDSKIDTIFADVQNVINKEVDDYFKIIIKFKNKVTAEIELGTYYLVPDRSWFMGGKKGSALSNGFGQNGKIVRTRHLLENVPGKITMSASGPTRSFGPPEPGLLYEEELPKVEVSALDYFENYWNALNGKEEIVVKADQVRRVLTFMDAVRKSAETNEAIQFE